MALAAGLDLPIGPTLALYPPADFDFAGLEVHVVQTFKPAFDQLSNRHPVSPDIPDQAFETAIVKITRSKNETRGLIAHAAKLANLIVVDGQKLDGIESHFKAVKMRATVAGSITKSHGRLFWFKSADFSDWEAKPSIVQGYHTRPGVFSADGPDPASGLLANALPDALGKRVADFGAGWGFLSSKILERESVQTLDIVEADYNALECAKQNIDDPRASFHWEDVTKWSGTYDTIVMNPPFHTGRKGTPDLGQAFIANAAHCLAPKGALWMVANRHLPYEAALSSLFNQVDELSGTSAFKVIHACHPKR